MWLIAGSSLDRKGTLASVLSRPRFVKYVSSAGMVVCIRRWRNGGVAPTLVTPKTIEIGRVNETSWHSGNATGESVVFGAEAHCNGFRV